MTSDLTYLELKQEEAEASDADLEYEEELEEGEDPEGAATQGANEGNRSKCREMYLHVL